MQRNNNLSPFKESSTHSVKPIKIIGTGISGLLTAYHLQKLIPENSSKVQIEIYDKYDESTTNASTNSLAWLNVVYPSKETRSIMMRENYDNYRILSLQEWQFLNKNLIDDEIKNVFASQQHTININGIDVNSIFIFFDPKQEYNFMKINSRLKSHTNNYEANPISKKELDDHFSFIANLPDNILIRNIACEQLINPKTLRDELIKHLKKSGVCFYWNTPITSENIKSEPDTDWILAAGNGCLPLIHDTEFENLDFCEKQPNLADVIHCTLSSPLDLKGKVFHFAALEPLPDFHLRNDEADVNTLKIIVARQTGKNVNLEKCAQDIFNFLQVNVKSYNCNDKVERPMTHDGRPLVEVSKNKNVHIIYGHSLFTNGSKLYRSFADNLAYIINQRQQLRQQENIFTLTQYHAELEQFSASNRFSKQVQIQPNYSFQFKGNPSVFWQTPYLNSKPNEGNFVPRAKL